MLTTLKLAIAIVSLTTAHLAAQSSALVFDVVSVRPNKTSTSNVILESNPTQVRFENLPLAVIIAQSFGLREHEIVGMPGWARSERFDINARTGTPRSAAERGEMLQKVLTDRFSLTFHKEQRTTRVYVVSIPSRDGRLGPNLRRSSLDCSVVPSPCKNYIRTLPSGGGIDIIGIGSDWSRLFQAFALELDGPVQDRTSLKGRFDMELRFGRDQLRRDTASEGYPAVLTALREQLGLNVEATVGLHEVLVIDAVSRPSPN